MKIERDNSRREKQKNGFQKFHNQELRVFLGSKNSSIPVLNILTLQSEEA